MCEDIKNKVDEIVNNMTDEEKLGQIIAMFSSKQIPIEVFQRFKDGIGELCAIADGSSAKENAERAELEWDLFKKSSNFPPIKHNEALTGLMAHDATVFPSAIGLAATFDPDAVKDMADVIRQQMLAEGTRQALAPVMDVARDPRWGRVGETFGEDPTLCAAMSVAYTKGLQTADLAQGVMATGKHFLGYACAEGGLNMASNPISERELREVYAKPFQAAISEANLASVMNSYGTLDRELIIGSKKILTDLLIHELGFDGLVVSDYMSINKMVDLKVAASPEEAGIKALKSGMDVELPMPYGYTTKLLDYIKTDEAAQKALDRATRKVIEAKIKLNIVDTPPTKRELLKSAYDRAYTEPINKKLAKESIVLLKNDGDILPLSRETKKVAVIGPHADSYRLLFGCYTYPAAFDRDTSGSMSDMPGMQNVSQNSDLTYQMPYFKGCSTRGTADYIEDKIKEQYQAITPTIFKSIQELCTGEVKYAKGFDYAGSDESGHEEAIELAKWADVVIVTAGGKYGWGSSCTTGEGIDCDYVGLNKNQEKFILKLAALNKSLILVHMDSKPLCSEKIVDACSAIVENWFPGDTGGSALAEVLFGVISPAGRLPMTAARNAGQIPIYASQLRGSGYRPGDGMTIAKYVDREKTPLFYFGHGLSYAQFEYSDLKISEQVSADGIVDVQCTVLNTGDIESDEVVQLYVSDEIASMIRPEQELAGFCRVGLKPKQKCIVHFQCKADQFAFLDSDFKWIVEKGKMQVRVGASSNDLRLNGCFEITDSKVIDGKKRGFYAKAWDEKITQ